jgi:hypothetical protein
VKKRGVLHFGSVSCDFLHFWKKLTGCRAIFFIGFLEVLYGIFCIFGSSSGMKGN